MSIIPVFFYKVQEAPKAPPPPPPAPPKMEGKADAAVKKEETSATAATKAAEASAKTKTKDRSFSKLFRPKVRAHLPPSRQKRVTVPSVNTLYKECTLLVYVVFGRP